jgi:hypothetical protein
VDIISKPHVSKNAWGPIPIAIFEGMEQIQAKGKGKRRLPLSNILKYDPIDLLPYPFAHDNILMAIAVTC